MRLASFAAGLALVGSIGALFVERSRLGTSTAMVRSEVTLPEVSRTNLVLTAGRLCLVGQTNAFHGFMVDHYADGTLRSRSTISNGVLHGVSEGWYTNRQLQVSEWFKEGVSDGLRTKWYPNGAKQSEASVVSGKLHGAFLRWYESGAVSERAEFVADRPEGVSLSFFPSGFLKARVRVQGGRLVQREVWKDGEFKQ